MKQLLQKTHLKNAILKGSLLLKIFVRPGLWVTSFIYKYETSTTYPLYETTRRFVLINKWHSWVQSALPTIRFFPQSGYDQHISSFRTWVILLSIFSSTNVSKFSATGFSRGWTLTRCRRRRKPATFPRRYNFAAKYRKSWPGFARQTLVNVGADSSLSSSIRPSGILCPPSFAPSSRSTFYSIRFWSWVFWAESVARLWGRRRFLPRWTPETSNVEIR